MFLCFHDQFDLLMTIQKITKKSVTIINNRKVIFLELDNFYPNSIFREKYKESFSHF